MSSIVHSSSLLVTSVSDFDYEKIRIKVRREVITVMHIKIIVV
jgi:hypothetical protein